MFSRSILRAWPLMFLSWVAATGSPLHAADWSATNLQLLHGNDFVLGPTSRSIMTLEHADGWAYGDNFFFVDVTDPDSAGTDLYAEFAPRLSLSRLTGRSIGFGPVKDFLVAGQVNHGQDFRAFLYGAGLDIAVPGFSFVQLNFYRRDVPALSGATWQVTGVWSLPVALGATRWTLAGFADWAGPEGGSRGNLLLVPQLRLDLGALWDWPGRLEAGVEYSYWRNKFGIDGVVESVVQPMVKWTL